jgi:hypothetical protein
MTDDGGRAPASGGVKGAGRRWSGGRQRRTGSGGSARVMKNFISVLCGRWQRAWRGKRARV